MITQEKIETHMTFCPHCRKQVVPHLKYVADSHSRPEVDVLGVAHARLGPPRRPFQAECPHCHHILYSDTADALNSEERRYDWGSIALLIGGILFMVLLYFAFHH